MIEHVSYAGGAAMFAESRRVLRSGGKLRISTPDLSFLIGLYRDKKSPIQTAYIKWASATFIADAPSFETRL